MIKCAVPVVLPCEKCGRKNTFFGSQDNLVFFKCDCGKILVNALLT